MQTVSIVIPTKNGGALLKRVVDAILTQDTQVPFDLLLIDSGSTDGFKTWFNKISKRDPRIHLHEIKPRDFQHGRTRNLAIQRCKGDLIALLTQDALPADHRWLDSLISGFKKNDQVAGVFGRHIAYSYGSPLVHRDIKFHFDSLNALPSIHRYEVQNKDKYEKDITYRQMLHFFSNNNSCIRRDIWSSYPFPEVDFAEDQAWAKSVIEAGYSIAYIHGASVYHSHDYSVSETFKRSMDESFALKKLFGYVFVPSKKALFKKTIRSTVFDWRYLIRSPYSISKLLWLFKSPFYNFAKSLGQYFAIKFNNNRPLSPMVSLDQKKKRI